MRAMTALLVLLFSLGAHAEKFQVRHCGDTLRQVANIVNQQFTTVNAGNLVACFKGNWGYGVVIEMDEKLSFAGYDFVACPQTSGRIYLHKKGDAQDGGILKCSPAKLTAAGFAGMLSVANGDYPRNGSEVASIEKRKRH